MLLGFDGFEVCRRLRVAEQWVPVLMLTARPAVLVVGYLRRKIDRPFGREDLQTVRGAGALWRASREPP